jgi:hypothetical protein
MCVTVLIVKPPHQQLPFQVSQVRRPELRKRKVGEAPGAAGVRDAGVEKIRVEVLRVVAGLGGADEGRLFLRDPARVRVADGRACGRRGGGERRVELRGVVAAREEPTVARGRERLGADLAVDEVADPLGLLPVGGCVPEREPLLGVGAGPAEAEGQVAVPIDFDRAAHCASSLYRSDLSSLDRGCARTRPDTAATVVSGSRFSSHRRIPSRLKRGPRRAGRA